MAEKCGFFNHNSNDRQYTDVDHAMMLDLFTGGHGYVTGKWNELRVIDSGAGLEAIVKSGAAWLGNPAGWWYINDDDLTVNFDAEVTGLDRIDRVVVRLDRTTENRITSIQKLKGVPSVSPVPLPLTQNESIFEISLAQTYITGGSPSIVITDERNSEYCGAVSLGVDGSKYKPEGDIKAEDNVARNLLTWNALTTQWEKAEFGQPYDGTHIILPGGTYVEKGAFTGLEGLRLYRQEDGTFSAIPREFEHYLGYVLDADKALIGVYGGVQNSYTTDLAMMQICIGAAGTLRVRQTMGANATGVMWRYKATPWVDGDTEQSGELLGVLTENYDEPNEWHTFTGLINGSTYHIKAFPFLGEMYNSVIGHNEDSIILQAIECHHTADNIAGSTVYDSIASYALAASNITYAQGKVGNGIVFGSNANLSRTNMMNSTGTQAFRVKMTAGQTLWAMGNLNYESTKTRGFQFYINSSLYCCMEMGDYTYNTGYHAYGSSAQVNSGTWTHVTFSHTATQTKVYIDGVYRATMNTATISMNTPDPYWFGQRHWSNGGTYSSSGIMIDDIVSGDEQLSGDNIAKLAAWGLSA